ncbi:hypothetical protein H0E86_21100 [Streptomyces sp. SCSIO-PteL053]|nr:hypothetical protein H0E86_21100 [Streptomyces sp. SCSIO-PteL053]
MGQTHWCSGSSGIGTFLVRLWARTGDERYREAAVGAAAGVRDAMWLSSPAACHGLAGNAEFLLDMSAALGDPRYREQAGELAACIHTRAVRRDGLLVVPDESLEAVTGGYQTGAAGTVGMLLRLRDGGPRLWMPDTPDLFAPPGGTRVRRWERDEPAPQRISFRFSARSRFAACLVATADGAPAPGWWDLDGTRPPYAGETPRYREGAPAETTATQVLPTEDGGLLRLLAAAGSGRHLLLLSPAESLSPAEDPSTRPGARPRTRPSACPSERAPSPCPAAPRDARAGVETAHDGRTRVWRCPSRAPAAERSTDPAGPGDRPPAAGRNGLPLRHGPRRAGRTPPRLPRPARRRWHAPRPRRTAASTGCCSRHRPRGCC